MGIPNPTHQVASNAIAGLGNWIALHSSPGAGTTGDNEVAVSGYTRVQSAPDTADGLGGNSGPQVNIPCPTSSPIVVTEGAIWSTESGDVLAVPSGLSISTATTGGAIPAGTRFYVMTAFNWAGETTASEEFSITTTGTTSTVTIFFSQVTGVYDLPALGQALAGYKFYYGSGSGAENTLVGTASASATSWTDTGAAGASATPPDSNTASTFVASSTLIGGPYTLTGSTASLNVAPGIIA